jgi:hypothetical protein
MRMGDSIIAIFQALSEGIFGHLEETADGGL